ncbi:hypothetical protein EDD16DRAFT_1514562 [Pisolithus croceorrhizus]|nr:hypothetical protein EV401DRAFT_1895425 [Pisolithus croceorrhizus]KAI6133428.1 hypothetical protein EDD16DRAFT_1514562 [Pisolithus croceorrhizus]
MSANPQRRPFTRRRRAGLVLATPSNSSSISNGAHTVVPEKRKPSEDTPGVHPWKKVTWPSPLGSTPFLIGGPSGHRVVSLKRQRSEELVGTYPFNKVARVVTQGIDVPPRQHYSSDEVAGNNWKNLQGGNSRTVLDDAVMQTQKCFLWSLPNELLILIADYLPRGSLLILTQVPASLRIEYVWRRTNAFVMPDSVWFSVTGATTDRHLRGLGVFFWSLQGCNSVPRVHIQLATAPRQPTHALIHLLDCIRASGCKSLHGYDVEQTYGAPQTSLRSSAFASANLSCGSKLEVLEFTSSLFFSPVIIPFTITTLCSSPIVHLTLMNTLLTAVQWSTLLKHLSLRHLLSLTVDGSCPTGSLVSFLACHSVTELTSSRGHPTIPPFPRAHARLPLPSLERLDGSPTFIHSLANLAKLPTTLESLTVHFYRPSLSDIPLLEDVLACTAHFPNLNELCVRIPTGVDFHLLKIPRVPVPSCCARVLFLMCLDLVKHDIIRPMRRIGLALDYSGLPDYVYHWTTCTTRLCDYVYYWNLELCILLDYVYYWPTCTERVVNGG